MYTCTGHLALVVQLQPRCAVSSNMQAIYSACVFAVPFQRQDGTVLKIDEAVCRVYSSNWHFVLLCMYGTGCVNSLLLCVRKSIRWLCCLSLCHYIITQKVFDTHLFFGLRHYPAL